MSPTLKNGQHFIVRPVKTISPKLRRSNLVIAQDPQNPEISYAKRVVGLPGEQITVKDGLLFIDSVHLNEPYLGGLPASLGLGNSTWSLGPAEFFVMGDNRHHSTDSRVWGPIQSKLITGKIIWRLRPIRRFGRVQ